MEACSKWKVPIVITSLGARPELNDAVHAWGGITLHDIIDDRFARKAIEKGADGLIAVACGAEAVSPSDIAAAAIGITYGVGKLPRSRRSIINLINCCITLMSRPRTGKYRGRGIPTSYSRTKARPANKIPSDDTTVKDATRDDRNAPTVRQMPINCGLDRLTADMTTAR